jgi:uncharacterized membrane protein YdjX (TVP38/TMEM64 family)
MNKISFMAKEWQRSGLRFIFLVIAIFLLWFLGRFFNINIVSVRGYLGQFPIFYAGLIFVALYVAVTFFIWFSKDVFRFAAALLFGPYLSTLLVFICESINAAILFHFSRFLGRDYVRESLKGRLGNLDEKIGDLRFSWLFLFRAVPLIPFRFLDLAAGLTRMTFKKYFAAVVLGSPLRIFWLQYILAGVGRSVFGDPNALTQYLLNNKPAFIASLIYLILVPIVAARLKHKG